MLEKYRERFDALPPAAADHLRGELKKALPVVDTEDVYEMCESAGLDQASVVMALARDATPEGVVCLETLVDCKLRREKPKKAKAVRVRGAAVQRHDPRVIAHVVDNPKRPNTASHARFALYVVGMSVSDALAAGVTMADIKWDSERGFIKLEDKK